MDLVPKKIVNDDSPSAQDRARTREAAISELEPFGKQNVAHRVAERDHIGKQLEFAEAQIDESIKINNVKSQELRNRR